MQHGEFWYAMHEPGGVPIGYARLVLHEISPGATRCDWQLRLAFPGGTYEEDRSAVHDADGRTLAASYESAGTRVEVTRKGNRLVGVLAAEGGTQPIDREVEHDALAGMGFVLAASMPHESGATRAFHDYNEAQGVAPEGEASFSVAGTECVTLPEGEIDAWRVVLERADGRGLPIWVDADRRIVQVDWGGGNLMILSPTPTRDLFRPS